MYNWEYIGRTRCCSEWQKNDLVASEIYKSYNDQDRTIERICHNNLRSKKKTLDKEEVQKLYSLYMLANTEWRKVLLCKCEGTKSGHYSTCHLVLLVNWLSGQRGTTECEPSVVEVCWEACFLSPLWVFELITATHLYTETLSPVFELI